MFGNCGTIVSFRVGAEDAERIARELGTFTEDDFSNRPRYHVYLRLMIDSIAGDFFALQEVLCKKVLPIYQGAS